jgi:hypothetical protein
MLNESVEVRSSTMLSQVELCFICPQFFFFFAKSRSIPCLCAVRRLTLLLVRFLFLSSLLTSSFPAQSPTLSLEGMPWPTTDRNDASTAMTRGEDRT